MENQFKGKNVLILGLGTNQGGVGAAKFFAKAGANLRVTDLKKAQDLKPSLDELKEFSNIEYIFGEHRFEDIDWADLIIKNQALKPDNQYLKYAREKGKKVETDMGIFLQFVNPQQIIGVTGTKGKSTTASLIYEILRSEGKEVIFAGNIGKSVLDTILLVKADTLIILEISSFQLEAFEQHQSSPRYAVITNIYPDHLNYYGSMESYIQSKRVIAQYQTPEDRLFLRKGDDVTNTLEFLKGLKGKIIYFSAQDLPKDFQPKLPGEHNLENMAAALAVTTSIFNLASSDDLWRGQALEVMKNFQGVEFRLQLIYNQDGIKIYNDTAATMPESTIQALKSLPNSILIAGGMNKNLSYNELAQAIAQYAKAVYFLEGNATDKMKAKLLSPKRIASSQTPRNGTSTSLSAAIIANTATVLSVNSVKQSHLIKGTYTDLEKLLEDVKATAKAGDTILFSPGATSFNMFQNEFNRGRKFNQAVKKIFG